MPGLEFRIVDEQTSYAAVKARIEAKFGQLPDEAINDDVANNDANLEAEGMELERKQAAIQAEIEDIRARIAKRGPVTQEGESLSDFTDAELADFENSFAA